MKIVITNDDGIASPALMPLVAWAQKMGEVTVIAPKYEQSCKSHAVEIRTPFSVERDDRFPGAVAFAVDSTPVDCIRYCYMGMELHPDLVLSGINLGFNLGNDIAYSATVAAASEAASLGSRALALSTQKDSVAAAFSCLDRVWRYLEEKKLWERHRFFSVNFPAEPRGIRITRQGGIYVTDRFLSREDGKVDIRYHFPYQFGNDLTLDTDAVTAGYISVSPLTWDATAVDVFRQTQTDTAYTEIF